MKTFLFLLLFLTVSTQAATHHTAVLVTTGPDFNSSPGNIYVGWTGATNNIINLWYTTNLLCGWSLCKSLTNSSVVIDSSLSYGFILNNTGYYRGSSLAGWTWVPGWVQAHTLSLTNINVILSGYYSDMQNDFSLGPPYMHIGSTNIVVTFSQNCFFRVSQGPLPLETPNVFGGSGPYLLFVSGAWLSSLIFRPL